MKRNKPIKFIIFFSLLGGAIFLIIALTNFPGYQSNFSAAIVEKEPVSRSFNAENNSQKIAYALNLTKHFLLSDFFIEEVEKNISLDLKSLSINSNFLTEEEESFIGEKWKINKAEWKRSLSLKKDSRANLIFIGIKAKNPKIAYLYSLEIARSFRESFPQFLNSEKLEIKILDKPTKALPDYTTAGYFSLLGLIFGGLTGYTITLIPIRKPTEWVSKKMKVKVVEQKQKRKDEKIIKKENTSSANLPEKKKSFVGNTFFREEKENLSDKKIKERLNRLINGEF